VNGEPFAMVGVCPMNYLAGTGGAWAMATDSVQKHRRLFMRLSRIFVRVLLGIFPRLHTFIAADYPEAIRWVRWLGWSVAEAKPFGPSGSFFHEVRIEA
jgi:hypothetical protein